MATSVTSYYDGMASPKYYTSPNTWQDMQIIKGTSAGPLFDQPVKMSDDETRTDHMFGTFSYVNSNEYNPNTQNNGITITLPGLTNFNSEVIIGKNITNCASMFLGCLNYNQLTEIPSSVTDCSRMFRECSKYNQPTVIPNGVTNCYDMFYGCCINTTRFDIPKSVIDCSNMFAGCRNMNIRDLYIFGNNLLDCKNMFSYGTYKSAVLQGVPSNIYISGINKNASSSNFSLCMLEGKANSKRCNIFVNGDRSFFTYIYSQYDSYYSIYLYKSIAGTWADSPYNTGPQITWSDNDVCSWNAAYNIYIYNNYTG